MSLRTSAVSTTIAISLSVVYSFVLLPTLTMATAGSGLAGGWKEQDVNSKDIKDLSWNAVKSINQQSNDLYYMMPIKVLSAKSQVVAGVNYELEILVGPTTCLKNKVSADQFKAEDCQEKENGQRKIFTVTVWQKPWENFEQVTIKSVKNAE